MPRLLLNRTIRKKLVDNPHRLDIVLAPDTECETRTEAKLAAEYLSAINAAPNPPELPELTITPIK